MNNLANYNFEKEFDFEKYGTFLLQQSINEFLSGVLTDEIHPIANKIIEFGELPELGSHLISQRMAGIYTHHGIYVGNGEVIEYSGSSEGFNIHDIAPINMNNRSSISKVSISEFTKNNNFTIKLHQNATYSKERIVERAYEKLNESEYNIFFNNCEHFANYCIYGTSSSKQTQGLIGMMSKVSSSYNHISVINEVNQISKSIKEYLNDEINGKKFIENIGYSASTGISSIYYASFAQVMIPIPILGAVIGSFVGYTLGRMLYDTGLFSVTSDSEIVKIAKEKRSKIEKICNNLFPIIERNRIEFEKYTDKYFLERKEYFNKIFDSMDKAIKEKNHTVVISELSKINKSFGKELSYGDIENFKSFLKS